MKRSKKQKETLEQFLSAWQAATSDLYETDEMMTAFLEIKKQQFIKRGGQ
jgi:hypothetical protein